ncbi:SIS domain-containing protein [Alphaproteobacteria bacterium]|nr:SIS domain-containing protein [Alphaproteobacteria bacterium]
MDYKKYFFDYTSSISKLLKKVDTDLINDSVNLIANAKKNNNKIYIIGNGGSASIASHVSVDFAKVAKIKCSTFNNSNLITCFANDYKYENWVVEAIKAYSEKKDLFILISSSGTSKNIVNAAQYCKKNNINLITLSGFKKNNPLSLNGKINFHVESDDYNFIEMTHHIILVSIVDIFAKKIF